MWLIEGPAGQQDIRVKGNLRSNSADFTRQALLAGMGIGLRSLWEVSAEIDSGKLRIVLPQYHGSSKTAIYALQPSGDYMPAKVDVFLEFLSSHFGREQFWELAAKPVNKTNGKSAPQFAKQPVRSGSQAG